ncbi:unnamed protein product [Microthlaspi erraticum]|uniref:Retrotransposon gag domain-containing protein n=1 Tax=Microthlaspi erraticum TaxID=1685480 RepID=A0A6D2HK86_9BRAS|nr:unnamed protein product [Microthlaspi erraticum]
MLYFLCTQPTYTFALARSQLIACSVQSGPCVRYPFTTSDLCTCRIRDRKGEDLIPRSSFWRRCRGPIRTYKCQALKHHHLLGIVLQTILLKTKKKLLPYLEAADLETSSQAASYQEEHLLATPEEEIDPELIEFVKRDQFHDLFSEYALEHIDHFDNLCDSYGVFDFEKKMMLFSTSLAGPALDWAQHEPLSTIESWIDFREAFLKRFARSHLSNPSTTTTLISWRESVMKKNGEAYHPILKFE